LQENAAIYVKEGADLRVGGNIENDGFIENLGKVSIYGNFLNRSIFNSTLGELALISSDMQQVLSSDLELTKLTIDGTANEVMLESDLVTITGEIDFINGVLRISDSGELIIESGAITSGGNIDSYFDGGLIQLGTGFKYYPIGNNGVFTPITMEDIRGINVKMRISSTVPNTPVPEPSTNVIGVSEHALWKLDLEEGSIDSILVSMEFFDADLENFTNRNDINADFVSPVIVKKDEIDGLFETLGVSELIDTDSITFGRITADEYLRLAVDDSRYVALGLAPKLPSDGSLYIPNAFSPNAIEDDNKSFKVFGVKVINEEFELKIFNRSNVLVYQTDDYLEANRVGWDGTSRNNGNIEPSGLYYYTITYKLDDGVVRREQNAIYLIR